MKTIFTLLALLFASISIAQSGINYKALIKDDSGNLLVSQEILVQFSILEDITVVYSEKHTPKTNENGIVIMSIGEGTPLFGSFSAIDWGSDDHFLQVEIDTGSGFVDLGTTQFGTVAYAQYARNGGGGIVTKIDDLEDGKSDNGFYNAGSSVFLGRFAGLNDDGTNNQNVGVGYNVMKSNTTGNLNTAIGSNAMLNNTTGFFNVANGAYALRSNISGKYNIAIGVAALYDNLTGNFNTATGDEALSYNTTGSNNTANGRRALFSNTTGVDNTATGAAAMAFNTTGDSNTATGAGTMAANTTGYNNTANGKAALSYNATGSNNSAVGIGAAVGNTVGSENTAIGASSSHHNQNGNRNTAIGVHALSLNTASNNTATGYKALFLNIVGANNTANGYQAMYKNQYGFGNTAIGTHTLMNHVGGNFNTAVGYYALDNLQYGLNNIGIGYRANVPNNYLSNQVRIGNTAITYAGIQVPWTITSDRRWKENIRELPYGLDVVMQLKPVDYVRENNDHKTREMGFIAQDVEALLAKVGYADQGFLTKDDDGYLSLRYNDLIALLTKALQEQQLQIESLSEELNRMGKLEQRMSQLEALLTSDN